MRKLLTLCNVLLFSVLLCAQTQTIKINGPSATSGPVVVTLEINAPPSCAVITNPGTSTINVNATQTLNAVNSNCPAVEDIVDWVFKSDRTTNHTTGQGNPGFNWLDADGIKTWFVKGTGGNPWDLDLYDGDFFYRWITDAGSLGAFTNPSAYKRSLRTNVGTIITAGVPSLPRYFVNGSITTIDTPGPNLGVNTLSCETDNLGTHDLKDIRNVWITGLVMDWGGDVGNGVGTSENDYYFSGTNGIYSNLEKFFYVKGWGRTSWQPFTLQGGVYVASQAATIHNINTTGGSPTPNFPCYTNLVAAGKWIGSTPPGGGSNAATPLLGSNPVKWTVNGIANGSPTVGVVNQGVYTAPSTSPGTVVVRAQYVGSPSVSGSSNVTVLAPPCTVSNISPASPSLNINVTQQFTANTTNCSPPGVFWYVNNIQGGDSTHGTISNAGLYTAPASVPAPATVTVKAATQQNQTVNSTTVVTVTNPPTSCSVTVSPKTATVQTSATQLFTANASTCTPTTVTWKVNGITGGNSTLGTISVGGLYTAPSSVPTPNSVTISAVSNQDGTTQDTAVVTITAPLVCSVSINPISATVLVTSTQQFTATATNCSPSTVFWQVNSINGGNSTVGTINGSGLYTAPANVPSPSTVTVTAVSNADNTKTASAMVTIITQTISVMDKDCLVGNIPTFTTDQNLFAAIPKSCYYTDPTAIPCNGTVRNVTAATWNTVWAATQPGDVVEITGGTTLSGNFTVPTKIGDKLHYVCLRTSTYQQLPPYGTKLSPCYNGVTSLPGRPPFNCPSSTNVMATINGTGNAIPFILSINTKFLKITGIVFTFTQGTTQIAKFIDNNAGGIDHIILDRDWFKGTDTNDMNGGLVLDRTSYFAIINSFFSNIHCTVGLSCTDAKAIGGGTNGNSTDNDNTWKIVGNYIEASGENVIFGGGGAAIQPTDIELRNNYFFKPQIWNPKSLTYNGGNPTNHQPYIVKNHLEMKNVVRIFGEGNWFSNVWGGFSQAGESVIFSPKNQAGPNGSNLCPLCKVTDYTFRYNHVDTAQQALQFINVGSDNGGMAAGGNHYDVYGNIFENLRYPNCNACSAGVIQLDDDPVVPVVFILHHVNVSRNTFVTNSTAPLTPPGAIQVFMNTGGATIATGNQLNNIVFQNNVFAALGGITTVGGGSASCAFAQANPAGVVNSCWLPKSFGGNVIVQPNFSSPTTGWNSPGMGVNCVAETTFTSLFVNYNGGLGGDYTIKPASPCHNKATDGTDSGAPISKTNSLTQGVNIFP